MATEEKHPGAKASSVPAPHNIDIACDDLAVVRSLFQDAADLVTRMEKYRATGTLKVPALRCFQEQLDKNLRYVLLDDWGRFTVAAGEHAHKEMPSLIGKESVPYQVRDYATARNEGE